MHGDRSPSSLHPSVREARAPLVADAHDQWIYDRMRAHFAVGRPRKPGRRALKLTITLLADLDRDRSLAEKIGETYDAWLNER